LEQAAFVAAFVLWVVAGLSFFWAAVLYVAHSYAERHVDRQRVPALRTSSSRMPRLPLAKVSPTASASVPPLDTNRINSYYRDRTDLQATQLIKPWIGQRVSFSGSVKDVGDDGAITSAQGRHSVFLDFPSDQRDRLAQLHPGDRVSVVGEIRSTGRSGWVSLRKCEFVDD